MKKYFNFAYIGFFFLIPIIFLYAGDCGVERWKVKTLSDPDTTKVDFVNIVESSIHEQIQLADPNPDRNTPRLNSETTIYSINCYILGYKKETDRDVHIIIQDPETKETMVAELPDPICENIRQTSRYQKFLELNDWFNENFKV